MPLDEEQHFLLLPVTSLQAPDTHHRSVISAERLKQLYKLMVRLRGCAPRQRDLRGKRRALDFGEACEAAAVIDLRPQDAVATFPDQRVALLTSSRSLINQKNQAGGTAEWTALQEGSRDRLAIAAGVAWAHRIKHTSSLVVAFAASEDIARSRESVRFAQRQSLPIIYLEKTPGNVRKSKPTSHNLPTIPVDASDAVAVYRAAYEAMDKARRGAGPTLIQCIGHQSLSARSRFVDQRADPIAYMEHYLRKQNLWSDDLRF